MGPVVYAGETSWAFFWPAGPGREGDMRSGKYAETENGLEARNLCLVLQLPENKHKEVKEHLKQILLRGEKDEEVRQIIMRA